MCVTIQAEVCFWGENMKISVKAYAKINLLLDILSRFENGYHNLFMIMQSVGLYDVVTVEETDDGSITIACEKEGVPTDERNIAWKAAESFFSFTGIENKGISITIEKNIPHAAGLAGGSADGAAVIVALNKIYGAELSYLELVEIGLKVGADVPFCIFGSTRLSQNIGDVLSELPPIPDCSIVICKPKQDVPTGNAYKIYDENAERIRHPDNMGMLRAVLEKDLEKICYLTNNVFEQVIEVCDRAYIKGVMRKFNAKAACMSGSGPTVFGIFDNDDDANKACEELKKSIDETYLCRPVKSGCEIDVTDII